MAIAACIPSALADSLVTDTSYYEFLVAELRRVHDSQRQKKKSRMLMPARETCHFCALSQGFPYTCYWDCDQYGARWLG